MPYEIVRSGTQFCVVKQGTSEKIGCHPTHEKARAQMAALYANEPMMGKANGYKDVELKAEGLTEKQLTAWLAGERSRRIVAVPFGGPLPGGKAGLDLDGEYFDEMTDLYGPFPALRATRERLVDWHHDDYDVPDGLAKMKGAILGKIVLDEGASTLHTNDGEYDGILADFWAKAGEERLALIRDLQRRRVPIYGSSQAVYKAVRKDPDGHIAMWPIYRHTISTSPQNTYAVVPALKALLTADVSFDDVGLAALRAALVGLDVLIPTIGDVLPSAPGQGSDAKAGRVLSASNEASLRRAVDELSNVLAKLLQDPQIAALAAEANG